MRDFTQLRLVHVSDNDAHCSLWAKPVLRCVHDDPHGPFEPLPEIGHQRFLAIHFDNERHDEPMTWPVAHRFHEHVVLLPAGLGHVCENSGLALVSVPQTTGGVPVDCISVGVSFGEDVARELITSPFNE